MKRDRNQQRNDGDDHSGAVEGKAKKPSGINVKLAMAWLLRFVWNRDKSLEPPPAGIPSTDPGHFGGGSPNMKVLYSVCWYAWAWLSGTDTKVQRERMLRIFQREKECWMQAEPTTSSHLQLHVAGMAITLWLAEQLKHADVAALATWWLSVFRTIHEATLSPQNEMWCPGGRCTTKPKNAGGVPLGANSTTPKLWAVYGGDGAGTPAGKPNQYDLAAWVLTRVSVAALSTIHNGRRRSDLLPPMAGNFHVRRWENGDFVAWYDDLDGIADTTFGAGVLNGEKWIAESEPEAHDRLEVYSDHGNPVMVLDAPRGRPVGMGEAAAPEDDSMDEEAAT